MSRGPNFRSKRSGILWTILGWTLLVVVGVGLTWYGFTWKGNGDQDDGQPVAAESSITPTTTQSPTPTPMPTLPPTEPPPPTFTPQPTVALPTATPATPNIVTGADGANVRSGPGTNFNRLGYLDPGAQVQVIGRYDDWWQVDYSGSSAWVFGGIVTASNTDAVPQVQPPPSPTPVPATATPVPTSTPVPVAPTPTPGPSADLRGLVANDYTVEGAPGPFGTGADIWFNMDITNSLDQRVYYEALGTWVEETGQFQESWTKQKFGARKHFVWRDHIDIPDRGTYHLWMRICFTDGVCVNMLGPITVKVE